MNDPIEDALSRMKPAELQPDLMARLTAARARVTGEAEKSEAGAGRSKWGSWLLHWLVPAGVCATAAVATVMVLESHHRGGGEMPLIADNSGHGNPANGALPFESENRLVAAQELGIMNSPNQRPFRLMQVDWVQADTLQPADGGKAVRVETHRRQVVPVALEIY